MSRVKRGTKARPRRKKVLKGAKGYYGGRHAQYRTARNTLQRALAYAFRGRKERKRQFRALWNVRISAAARQNGLSYSRLICGLKKAGVALDNKILADLAVTDPAGFTAVAELAKANV